MRSEPSDDKPRRGVLGYGIWAIISLLLSQSANRYDGWIHKLHRVRFNVHINVAKSPSA